MEYNKQVALETILSLQGALTHKKVGDPCFNVSFFGLIKIAESPCAKIVVSLRIGSSGHFLIFFF